MITVERTTSGLCGETQVSNGTRALTFQHNADVVISEHGVSIVETGLAATRITYLLGKTAEPHIVDAVRQLVPTDPTAPVIVIHDADHSPGGRSSH